MKKVRTNGLVRVGVLVLLMVMVTGVYARGAYEHNTYKPRLMAKEWVAVAGEPLAAMAGAKIFLKGGNAVDAAAAILAATCVMNDSLSFGGETQTLIYDPNRRKVFGINGCGVAATGATAKFYLDRGFDPSPPGSGPLAAITPGTPGGLMLALAEFGRLSLAEVLEPAIDLAEGYPMEPQTAALYAQNKERFQAWEYSKAVYLQNAGEAPEVGQIFIQNDLANTLRKLVATEQEALAAGKSRKEAIMAANDRFYRGDIAVEFSRGSQEYGGLHTVEDLANWYPRLEEPLMTTYHGIEVYKLKQWTQGPVLLQMLNILEGIDLESMEHNSAEYIHTLYQVMSLAYTDRDFYYGDASLPPEEPMKGLLSKEYAAERRKLINPNRNDPTIGAGDPYPYQGEKNPYKDLLEKLEESYHKYVAMNPSSSVLAGVPGSYEEPGGTTSLSTADSMGWVVSCTPSGGWPAAFIAGKTGVGMSQRMGQAVLHRELNPYGVIAPGKQPRVTLTPSMALKDGHPFLAFNVPGGDEQDQEQLQFFLNVVHFGMDVQEAWEAT